MALNLQQKKNILDLVANFAERAKSGKWASYYDADIDALAVHVPELSSDVQKKHLNDEFAFYVNGRNEVEGIFIEYFLANFLAHHKEMKVLEREIAEEINTKKAQGAVFRLEDKGTKGMLPGLESALLDSLAPATRI
jgi:hypothetical protein